ncbi:hypothetical protein NA57DRAFT_33659 [Rhizodiscina lignyota]|uniref:Zn(2)-C6 fungal-type domain-containing protein n=1 Tax=Rhizodiscina lignyota TaxID=1504668 RepID=A0A9P4IL06_9PEZI|nr:hypothetical protein NA57DRAFT_33659 [Rhizodiscina lignyota]
MAEAADEQQSPGEHSARKRRKITRACDACKARKKACTGKIPCATCVRNQTRCTYDSAYNRGVAVPPQPSLAAISDRPREYDSGYNLSPPQDPGSISGPPSRRLSPEAEGPIDVAGQYSGPVSAHSFLGRAIQKFYHGAQPTVLSPPAPEDGSSNTSIFSFGDRKVSDATPCSKKRPALIKARELATRYFEFSSPTYRVLHQGTVEGWMDDYCPSEGKPLLADPADPRHLPAASKAIILMVCATASMYRPDHTGSMNDADESDWLQSEAYYRMAEQFLSNETGAPSLGSVQARFLTVLYLLSSSRVNKAWFTFGTAVQLLMALGYHRRQKPVDENAPAADRIAHECQKRVLWCSFTLDKYLSLMLGRPRMLQEDDINQEFPAMVNDEDLISPGSAPKRGRDCIMAASVFHAQISQILARASKELYVVQTSNAARRVEAIVEFAAQISDWHDRLPPTLSGAIHPSSLIPTFRRQLTVLQLARDHALMFVTRPLLLRNYAKILPEFEASYRHHLSICVKAARDTVELVLYFVREEKLFSAFWYTQYIVFNALSVIYIYLIQVQRGRIPVYLTAGSPDAADTSFAEQTMLYELADTAHNHLAQATVRNSPLWRYSAILQGLRGEIHRLLHRGPTSSNNRNGTVSGAAYTNQFATGGSLNQTDGRLAPELAVGAYDTPNIRSYDNVNGNQIQQPLDPMLSDFNYFDANPAGIFDSLSTGDDLGLDFWTHMDSYPVCTYTSSVIARRATNS